MRLDVGAIGKRYAASEALAVLGRVQSTDMGNTSVHRHR
jgi:hypothetical protein